MNRTKPKNKAKEIVSNVHVDAKRKGIPTGESEVFVADKDKKPVTLKYPRNTDLDPQLVWRGKDALDEKQLTVDAYPIYIQEKIHPKQLIDDLKNQVASKKSGQAEQLNFFADFNGVPEDANRMDFYSYDQKWTNRMILGDSLQVMASLAEKEELRGKVQCIYFDPPYGIKFTSNFQWSTTTTNVKDGVDATREPEMVKAFRDTWKDGIHSYLSYIRDRLTLARDLLTPSGSVFVQIGDENVHRVRSVLDEVFGDENFVSQIAYRTTTGRANDNLPAASNYLLWFAKDRACCKVRKLFQDKSNGQSTEQVYNKVLREGVGVIPLSKINGDLLPNDKLFRPDNLMCSRPATESDVRQFEYNGHVFKLGKGTFKTDATGLFRLGRAARFYRTSNNTIQYVRYYNDFTGWLIDGPNRI